MTGTRICMYGIIVVVLAVAPTFADTHTEVGDAGGFRSNSQVAGTVPGNPLDSITGAVSLGDDADMYAIWIGNPAAFSASTDNAVRNFDTQLFLFDSAGLGLLSNDDGPTSLASELPAGSLSGAAGLYYIAVSPYNNEPSSAGGAIFTNNIAGVNLPTDPGAVSPISMWSLTGGGGDYRIDLTGTAIPLPAAVWAGLALLGGIGLKRMRRRVA